MPFTLKQSGGGMRNECPTVWLRAMVDKQFQIN